MNLICYNAGFSGFSTEAANNLTKTPCVEIIPYPLIIAYGDTTIAAQKFDKYISQEISRMALIDTYNKEITDSLNVAKTLSETLTGVKINTCSENTAEGSLDIALPAVLLDKYPKYNHGCGVTISAVWALRLALNKIGFNNLSIMVSGGFNTEKISAFIEADKEFKNLHGSALFDSIASGSLIENINIVTTDIVQIFDESVGEWYNCSKTGRYMLWNKKLRRMF